MPSADRKNDDVECDGANATAEEGLPQHIANELDEILENRYMIDSIQHAKSAQQRVWILHLAESGSVAIHRGKEGNVAAAFDWRGALQRGRNHIVVRQWLGGCRWWNLHQNDNIGQLAKAEIHGYRQARRAFVDTQRQAQDQGDHLRPTSMAAGCTIVIPQVLHYEPSKNWAVLEYVGSQCARFDDGDVAVWDESWLKGMILQRYEFGFEEPHPRWGRVPVDDALEYALMVLRAFIIPLHRRVVAAAAATMEEEPDDNANDASGDGGRGGAGGICFADMVRLYATTVAERLKPHTAMLAKENNSSTVTTAISTTALSATTPTTIPGTILSNYVVKLEEAVHRLQEHCSMISKLPHVLVHMDLQPQNLMFGRESTSSDSAGIFLHSVLDWEEAAWADPRFELLLLGRKVCANLEQAEALWNTYSREMWSVSANEGEDHELGSIRPWLQLECVHSITTLLLQSFALLNGGRNPWEKKKDLLGKIDREYQRLERLDVAC